MEVKQIGNLTENAKRNNPNRRRVYDNSGLAPTLTSGMGEGGNLQPFTIVAMRGRNPKNPSDRTAGNPTEQRLEPNSQGICNTLTSVQKDNMVLENVYDFYNSKLKENGTCGTITGACSHNGSGTFGVIEKANFCIGGLQKHQTARFDGISPSLMAAMGMGGGQTPLINSQYRIRKLTPLECWRLMGFSDKDFRKAEEVNSNTQLYKQAGNSIVKPVLMAILGQMIPGKEDAYKNIEEA